MDIGYLKIKIDILSEFEEYKKKYQYKRKELKKEEIKRVYDGFKDFFKADGHFKFKETDHNLTAEYKDYGITLEMDVYKNIDSPEFNLQGCIRTFDKDVYEFAAEAIASKDIPLQPADVDEQERMIHDTRYFRDFLNGEITYIYKYSLKGREGVYESMQELLLAL